jgi:hypothetical protein
MAGINLPTYGRSESAVTSRAAEYADDPDLDFDGGLNLGASNAPGIGICTGVVNPKLSDWTVDDQFGVTRAPQGTQHIGITGLVVGSDNPLLKYDVQAAQYEVTPGVDDINDTLSFIEATIAAAPGADAGSGVINRSDETLTIGDRIWGTDTVA